MDPQNQEDILRRILDQMREMSMVEVPRGYIVSIEGEEQRQRFFTITTEDRIKEHIKKKVRMWIRRTREALNGR